MRRDIKATPLTVTEMAVVLEAAYRDVFPGEEPTQSELSWLLGLARNENANGRAIIQYNWGNRVPGKSRVDYWVPNWANRAIPTAQLSPRDALTRTRLDGGKPVPTRFAAYDNHEQGAAQYLKLFKATTHQRIREAAKANDAGAFHRAVYTPHPVTKMSYCPDCGGSKVGETYRALAESSRQFYEHLEDRHDAKKRVASGGGSSPSPSWGSGPTAWRVDEPAARLRSWGRGVAVLQLTLGGLKVDGDFGPVTKRKAEATQHVLGLKVDGYFGPKSWDALLRDQTS